MVRLIQMLHAEHDRPALERNSSAILCYSRVRLQQMRRHIETQIDRVILRPTLANRQVFTRLCACDLLAVHLDTVLCRPSRNANIHDKLAWGRRANGHPHIADPRVVRLLLDLQPRPVMQVPVHLRVVIKMNVNAVRIRAVEVSRKRCEGPLQVRRTAGRVVPRIADLAIHQMPVPRLTGRVKRQRIAVAIGFAVERHPRVDTVVQRPLDHIGELRVARRCQHAPVPHHVSNGRAALPVCLCIWEFVLIAKGLACGPRSHAAIHIELMRGQIVPKYIQRLPIGLVAALQVVVSGAATCIHRSHRMPFELGTQCKRNPAVHIDDLLRL